MDRTGAIEIVIPEGCEVWIRGRRMVKLFPILSANGKQCGMAGHDVDGREWPLFELDRWLMVNLLHSFVELGVLPKLDGLPAVVC